MKNKAKILCVDDSPANLHFISAVLQKNGYETILAGNGEKALTILETETPTLVLLDVVMPVIDGYTVCQKMQENEKWREIPVIFLTVREKTEEIVKGFEIGAVDYLTKPFQIAELLARVNTHVRLKNLLQQKEDLIQKLQAAQKEINHLNELIPICANCKKVRSDDGFWQRVEDYISHMSGAQLTHSLCPECLHELYPNIADKVLERTAKKKEDAKNKE